MEKSPRAVQPAEGATPESEVPMQSKHSPVTLEITQEPIRVTTGDPYEPDPNWTFTDAQGHKHDASRETLEWVVTRTYWCEGCRDEHEEGELRCRICGEQITPGRRYAGHERMLPGLLEGTLTIDGRTYRLRPEELKALPASEQGRAEWIEKVQEREPDAVDLSPGNLGSES